MHLRTLKRKYVLEKFHFSTWPIYNLQLGRARIQNFFPARSVRPEPALNSNYSDFSWTHFTKYALDKLQECKTEKFLAFDACDWAKMKKFAPIERFVHDLDMTKWPYFRQSGEEAHEQHRDDKEQESSDEEGRWVSQS